MGKHKDESKDTQSGGYSTYQPKHSGGWDGEDWAKHTNATAETAVIPKVEDKEKN
jgi:hypothetical protein